MFLSGKCQLNPSKTILRSVYCLISKGTAALYIYFRGAMKSLAPVLSMKTIELTNSILQNSLHTPCLVCRAYGFLKKEKKG